MEAEKSILPKGTLNVPWGATYYIDRKTFFASFTGEPPSKCSFQMQMDRKKIIFIRADFSYKVEQKKHILDFNEIHRNDWL